MNAFDQLGQQLGAGTDTNTLHLTFHAAKDGKEACYRNATQMFPAGSVKIAYEQGWIDPNGTTVDGDKWTIKLTASARPFKRTNGIWGFTDKVEQTAASFAS